MDKDQLPDIYQNTRLHIASARGDEKKVKDFLEVESESEHRDDVNAVNDDHRTALHMSTSNDYVTITKMLLQAQASVNIQCKNGNTALHDAVYFGASPAIFDLLLSAGANKNIKNNKGETALFQAKSKMLDYSQQGILLHNLTMEYGKIIEILEIC